MMIVFCLVSWVVLSVAVGVFVGTAIKRAEAMELRRVPCAGPARERAEPEPLAMSAFAPAPPSGPAPHRHAWAA